MTTADLHLHLRSVRGVNREWDAEPVLIAIDMPGDGDPEQEAAGRVSAGRLPVRRRLTRSFTPWRDHEGHR